MTPINETETTKEQPITMKTEDVKASYIYSLIACEGCNNMAEHYKEIAEVYKGILQKNGVSLPTPEEEAKARALIKDSNSNPNDLVDMFREVHS